MENLVIVESPAKAKTIEKILGKDYTVRSSFGHIRDLAKKGLGIDVEHGFAPQYEISPDKKKVVSELKEAAGNASVVWLASDEDREGEAIAWHLKETLGLDPSRTRRIVFHEITNDAILNAIKEPRDVDMNLVMAQQARRVLDRLVGFELSPILWKKIKPSLSAGRVQSVALRLVVEREREINSFEPKAYYKVEGVFEKSGVKMRGILDSRFDTREEAEGFLEKCRVSVFTVGTVEKKEVSKCPAPPFTTSSLQQEAARKCGFSVSQTMSIAQHLYESGLITYMRTDSTTLSKLAIGAAKSWITENLGARYHKARQYKTGVKGAQEAHEAIRPTYIANTDIQGTAQEKKLYNLIWKRTVASQMADALLEKTDITVTGDKFSEHFDVTGSTVLFDGFLKLYMESPDDDSSQQLPENEENLLPAVAPGDIVRRETVTATEKYTLHPSRYSEASLVRKMEELGIGRPSTYAPTISTLHQRGYILRQDRKGDERTISVLTLKGDEVKATVKKETSGSEKGRLCPQDIGMLVTDFLEKAFPSIMDYGFTARVEADFDKIANGKMVWNKTVADFYKPFHERVVETINESAPVKSRKVLGTDPATGKTVIVRMGRYGSVVQLGEDDDPDKKITGLEKGMLIESVTMEDALKLFQLPRTLGEYNGKEVICSKGRFGPYVKYDGKFVSLKKGDNPLTITLDDAVKLIQDYEVRQKNKDIKSFPEADIFVLNGRFGPYIKHAGANYRIPKDTDPATLTEEQCRDIIESSGKGKKIRK